jgi:hypothetical protein
VALVPPKRIGVLQSAVNLHLLVRMAKNADKQLVLVTNNQALIALSAAAAIPVAKNLQSKPELAEIPALAVDEGEDIIDGAQLPVGELAGTAAEPVIAAIAPKRADVNTLVDTIDVDGEAAVAPIVGAATAPTRTLPPRTNIKVPNFTKFRKKLFLGIGALVVLILFLVWANVYAPAATVVITAKTIADPISQTVTLGTAATNVSTNTIQTVPQTYSKSVSVKFTATGSQDDGTPASGNVTFQEKCSSVPSNGTPVTIPKGTGVTSGSYTYITQSDIPVTNYVQGSVPCIFNGTGTVVAQANGTGYNLPAGSSFSANGYSSVTGSNSAAMSGGVSKIVTVVSANDVTTATAALASISDSDAENQLISQYKDNQVVIKDSFVATHGTPVSVPAVGQEADSQATLTLTDTYVIQAVAQPDIKQFLDASLKQQINGAADQRVYDDGISKVVLAGYSSNNGVATVNIATTGQVGPNINIDNVKTESAGKKSGEVQAELETIDGVSDAEVKFSYPWVTVVPKDTSKIDVQFNLTNG